MEATKACMYLFIYRYMYVSIYIYEPDEATVKHVGHIIDQIISLCQCAVILHFFDLIYYC